MIKKNHHPFGFVLVIVISILTSVNPAEAQKTWSLQECIEYAIKNNITIKQVEISSEIANVNYTQSKASMFPSLNANGSYSYNFGKSLDPFTYDFTNQEIQSSNFSLNGSLAIFNGLQLQYGLQQSKYEYYASRENLQKIKNDIALNVAAAYLQVLYGKESLKAADDRLESAQQNFERTKLMVDAGSMARGNQLDAEAALAAEELAKVSAENLLSNATISLMQLLELNVSEPFAIADPVAELPDQSTLALQPLDIYNTSMKILPEFRAAEFNEKTAEKGLSIAQGGRYPRLSLFGSISSGYTNIARRLNGEEVPFGDQIDENFNKSVGISLSIPIFNGWSTESNIKRARLNYENTKYSGQLLRNESYKSIVLAHTDAVAALKKYYAAEKAVIATAEAFTYAEKKYEVGMLSSIEYLNVRNNRSKAESDFLQAKYDFIFRMKIIDFYLGKPLTF